MTEKEQWIEREARKALVEYNWGSDFWDDHSFEYQERWRRVVTPYYPEPVRVPVDVEALAEAMRASYANEYHDCAPNTFDLAPFMVEARAALAWLDGKRGVK